MIKIITTVVCSFAAMLMLIIALATTYWLQWTVPSEGHNVLHFRGLFRQCWEARDNVTDELIPTSSSLEKSEDCTDWFAGGLPGWTGAVVAFLILGLLSHLVAFILAAVNACRKGQPFPVILVAIFFVIAAVCIIIALFVYTFKNWEADVFFSWSYGGGWSTVALSVIAFVLIMADR